MINLPDTSTLEGQRMASRMLGWLVWGDFLEGRCPVCGWPLEDSADKGCTPGNCSERPLPKERADDPDLYNPLRVTIAWGVLIWAGDNLPDLMLLNEVMLAHPRDGDHKNKYAWYVPLPEVVHVALDRVLLLANKAGMLDKCPTLSAS